MYTVQHVCFSYQETRTDLVKDPTGQFVLMWATCLRRETSEEGRGRESVEDPAARMSYLIVLARFLVYKLWLTLTWVTICVLYLMIMSQSHRKMFTVVTLSWQIRNHQLIITTWTILGDESSQFYSIESMYRNHERYKHLLETRFKSFIQPNCWILSYLWQRRLLKLSFF